MVFAVFLGFICVDAHDAHDELARVAQRGGEIGDLGRLVLAAEIYLVFRDFTAVSSGGSLFDAEGNTSGIVLNRECGLDDFAVAVTDERDVLAHGVVECDTKDLTGLACALEGGADVCALASIDRMWLDGMFSW